QPLGKRLRDFAAKEDELILEDLKRQLSASGTNTYVPPKWQAGYSAGTLASSAMFCLGRYEQTGRKEFGDLIVKFADAYLNSRPEEDVDAWPMSFGHAISTELAAYRLTKREVYLNEARRFAGLAVNLFWQDKPLPRASLKSGHYETITGADSLALALLEIHAVTHSLPQRIPLNTI